jgi:hypothetical protein
MITVYKYMLPAAPGLHTVEMPPTAEIIAVREQFNSIAIWARVLADSDKFPRGFRVIETGKEAPESKYQGTAIFADGRYVLHVFDGE